MSELSNNLEELHKRLAYDLDVFWVSNERAIQSVVWGSRVAASALGAEVVLLLASVGGNLG